MATPTAKKQQPGTSPEIKDENFVRGPQEEAAAAAGQASGPQSLSREQVQSATDWFLSDEEERPSVLYFEVNVAATGQPDKWVRWGVRTLTRQEIKDIRREATDPNTGLEDDMEVNLRVLIRGSVDPNFADAAVRGQYADPADLVNKRFAHKPGIIEAVSRKVNEMSGYAGASVIREIDAAGN